MAQTKWALLLLLLLQLKKLKKDSCKQEHNVDKYCFHAKIISATAVLGAELVSVMLHKLSVDMPAPKHKLIKFVIV